MTPSGLPNEFELIARLFAPLAKDAPEALGLLDDAACLAVPAGAELVITKDAIVAGVHFLPDDPPESIAKKLLRVNLSDLAAKGAVPAYYLLAAILPKTVTLSWLDAFAAALGDDQKTFGVSLIGGDTTATEGPLTLSLTALGFVPRGAMLRRDGARPGDTVFVTGTIGDAVLGLEVSKGGLTGLSPAHREALRARYRVPEPRVSFGAALRGLAHAAIDVSDGLVADLAHILEVSKVGAHLDLARVPLSDAGRAALAQGATMERLVTGGDDYEILFTAPPLAATPLRTVAKGLAVTEIGTIVAGSGLTATDASGSPVSLAKTGFRHF